MLSSLFISNLKYMLALLLLVILFRTHCKQIHSRVMGRSLKMLVVKGQLMR